MTPSRESRPSDYYYIVIPAAGIAVLLATKILTVHCCSCDGLVQAIRRVMSSLGIFARPREDEEISRLVPSCKYKREQAAGDDECSVCLMLFAEGEDVRQLPGCNHMFHAACIDMWFYSHANCPLCRCNILPAPLRCPQG